MIHSWLRPIWTRLTALGERMPHALLLVGPAGVGKRDLAEALAASLLCTNPAENGEACGVCASCVLRLSRNHPDLHWLLPEALMPEREDEEPKSKRKSASASADKEKAKSNQIVIDQVRELQAALTVTAHQGGRRVVLVEPADAMNTFTANALLKLLEEPPEECVFVLCCSAPRRLLPTIRSRCQSWSVPPPDRASIAEWGQGKPAPWLALAHVEGGMPLAAERLAAVGMADHFERFMRDIEALSQQDALVLAGQWESWLKSREAMDSRFDMPHLLRWMQCWVTDLATLSMGGRVRFYPSRQKVLAAMVSGCNSESLTSCYNELVRMRKVAHHPLNARLLLEDMLLRYKRSIAGKAA